LLEQGGPLLGALEGAEFQSGELMLEPGDTLVAYSDGVLECRNPAGEEFGLDRLIASLLEAKQPSAEVTLMMLLAAVQDFANGNPPLDDMSLTLMQRDAEGARES
jgi:sigma-B regulation protein RsbU (phosphoserine phosphatase)